MYPDLRLLLQLRDAAIREHKTAREEAFRTFRRAIAPSKLALEVAERNLEKALQEWVKESY